MPIYEYECAACRQVFEHLVRSAADERGVTCPHCQAKKVERRQSVFSAHGASPKPLPRPAGCGRCGDPNGPCSLG